MYIYKKERHSAYFNAMSIIFGFLSSIIIGLKFSQLTNVVSNIFYLWLFIIAIYSFVFALYNRASISFLGVWFLIFGIFSLIFNDVNELFRPYQRLFLFIIMFIGYGPIFQSKANNDFRYLTLKFIQYWFIILTIGSFITYFLNVPFAFGRAGFKGLTPHSMDLSPISALTALYAIDQYVRTSVIKKRYILVVILLISIITMFMSASRGAILSFIFSCIVYTLYRSNKIKKAFLFSLLLLALIGAMVKMNPFNMLDGLNAKMERTESDDDFTGGRSNKMEPRIMEFEESPLFGCGFSTMKYTQVNSDGHFEPGSGWIFILSSMGLLGFITAILLNINALNNCWGYTHMAFWAATCIFFIFHTMIEGYSLTVGNPLCVYMWTTIGLISNKNLLQRYD